MRTHTTLERGEMNTEAKYATGEPEAPKMAPFVAI